MNAYFYVSKNFQPVYKISKVLKDLGNTNFYFSQEDNFIISTLNTNEIFANFLKEGQVMTFLREIEYILLFFVLEDKPAINLIKYATKKGKNLIIIPDSERPY